MGIVLCTAGRERRWGAAHERRRRAATLGVGDELGLKRREAAIELRFWH
jgi:hypothetical protein